RRRQVPATSRRERSVVSFSVSPWGSERFGAGLAGADAHDLLEVEDEDLPVADLPGVGALLDRLDDALEDVFLDRRLDLHLGKEVDDVLGAAIELRVALLPAEALHFRDRDALH